MQKTKIFGTYIRAGYGPLNVILNARTSSNRHLQKGATEILLNGTKFCTVLQYI